MTPDRSSDPRPKVAIARAGLSGALLVALVVAVPAVLLAVGGSPIPRGGIHHLVTIFKSSHGFDGTVATSWLVHGSLVLAWLTWAWMLVCVAFELRSWVTGRSSPHLPGSRTMQAVAACLVGTTLACMSMGRVLPTPTTHASGQLHTVEQPIRGTDTTTDAGKPTDHRVALPRQWPLGFQAGGRVESGTSALRVVNEASVMMSTPPLDPDLEPEAPISDQRVPFEASDLHPTSDVPFGSPVAPSAPAGVAPAEPTGSPSPASDRSHTVAGRETLWSIAESRLGSARRWHEIAELNFGVRQADGGALTESRWVEPGWVLALPGPDRPQTRSTADHPDGSGRWKRTGAAGPAGREASTHSDQADKVGSAPDHLVGFTMLPPDIFTASPDVAARLGGDVLDGLSNNLAELTTTGRSGVPPIDLVGTGLFGAGVVALLERMRKAQHRHRRDGALIPLPHGEIAEIESRIRMGEGRRVLAFVDRALDRFAEPYWLSDRTPPWVLGVHVHPTTIELLVSDRVPYRSEVASSGPGPERRSVILSIDDLDADRLSTTEGSRGAAGGAPDALMQTPAPTLVSVGRGADGPLFVNLEAIGSLGLVGEWASCEGLIRALALELATSRWAREFDLVLVGFGHEMERFDRVTVADDEVELLHRLDRRRIAGDELLRIHGMGSFLEARAARWPGCDPMVVIIGPGVDPQVLPELVAAGSDPRTSTAIVACGEELGTGHLLTIPADGTSSLLEPIGSVLFPQQVEAADLEGVQDLLATAKDLGSVDAEQAPYAALSIPLPRVSVRSNEPAVPTPVAELSGSGSVASAATEREFEVEIRVLGPVDVVGASRPFTRAWAKELVVYLAMHPHGVSNDAWAAALWPDRLMAASSLHSTASVARRSLGHGADGRDHLPRAHGRLALSQTVGTDWQRFVSVSGRGELQDLRQALALVRGRPFDGLRASDWPILEGIAPAMEAAVVDVAGRLAGLYLRRGDAVGAEWAARRGLVVSPYDERLYRMLLRAADTAGNPAGVESVMSELLRLVADEVEPFDSVHPSTMELYRSLTRRNRLVGALR